MVPASSWYARALPPPSCPDARRQPQPAMHARPTTDPKACSPSPAMSCHSTPDTSVSTSRCSCWISSCRQSARSVQPTAGVNSEARLPAPGAISCAAGAAIQQAVSFVQHVCCPVAPAHLVCAAVQVEVAARVCRLRRRGALGARVDARLDARQRPPTCCMGHPRSEQSRHGCSNHYYIISASRLQAAPHLQSPASCMR